MNRLGEPSNSPCESNIPRHDRHSLSVDCTEVCVLKQLDQICLCCLLRSARKELRNMAKPCLSRHVKQFYNASEHTCSAIIASAWYLYCSPSRPARANVMSRTCRTDINQHHMIPSFFPEDSGFSTPPSHSIF